MHKIKLILLFSFVFLFGWVCNTIYGSIHEDILTSNNIVDLSSNQGIIQQNHIEATSDEKNPITSLFSSDEPSEKVSPSDRIKENQIHVYNNRVVIDIKNPEWASFTDTNSMDPVFDYGSNAIEIVPQSSDEIEAGDIVSYSSKYASGIIIHRVIKIGTDEQGWYAILKGDNNEQPDPGRVRFSQIRRVLVAIIY
jgi:hypothetical protein